MNGDRKAGLRSAAWREPEVSGRLGGASRLTRTLAMAVPASVLAFLVLTAISVTVLANKALFAALMALMSLVMLAGFLAIPAAIVSFVFDRLQLPAARAAAAETAQTLAHAEQLVVDRNVEAARRALAEVYTHHEAALVSETKRLLMPDRYGRRDEQAAAREFSEFQTRVARPELIALGHSEPDIQQAFDTDKADLLRAILKAV